MDLNKLKLICENCDNCDLSKTRNHVVFGAGNEHAKVMFIGEGPGANEDATGIPFVGKAGQLFDKMLAAIQLTRNDIYIANIVKCRPPRNRDPLETEKKACLDYLRWQVKLIQPKIIVCLGRVAAQVIIDKNFKITRQHGIWFERGNFSLLATYHPAALLRDETKKRDSWEDLKKIKEKYNLLV